MTGFVEVGPCPTRLPSTALALFVYGGVDPRTSLCFARDLSFAARLAGRNEAGLPGATWDLVIQPTGPDALIGRARSRAATDFLNVKRASVLVMIDHDIEWQGPTDGYEGDLAHIARLAAQHRAIVGAMIAKRTKHEGIASMIKHPADVSIGKPGLYEAHVVGSGMTAYPRCVLQAVYDKLGGAVPPGFCPMFVERVLDFHPQIPSEKLHVSEDWTVSEIAWKLGFPSYLASQPITGHVGEHVYTVVGDAYPDDQVQRDEQPAVAQARRVRFSLLHATRWRPAQAQVAHDAWVGSASGEHDVEYIYSTDDDDPETNGWGLRGGFVVTGPSRGNVDAYNRAAYASTGEILIQVHDDLEPVQGWDKMIAEKLDTDKPQVLHVSDGLPPGVNNNPKLIPIMICTRPWARKLGGLWFPDYISICCDNDASEKAYAEGAVVEAPDIVLHHHWGGPSRDDTQKRSYAKPHWDAGFELLAARREAGFPDAGDRWPK